MLMLINPGYAASAQEQQAAFAMRKVADLRERIGRRDIGIAVDGRVSLERIPDLVKSGADFLVAGTSCLFLGSGSYAENLAKIRAKIEEGRQMI
jgi:ribulose-phosphate 3-epimerase